MQHPELLSSEILSLKEIVNARCRRQVEIHKSHTLRLSQPKQKSITTLVNIKKTVTTLSSEEN